jgi:hypothetical protein
MLQLLQYFSDSSVSIAPLTIPSTTEHLDTISGGQSTGNREYRRKKKCATKRGKVEEKSNAKCKTENAKCKTENAKRKMSRLEQALRSSRSFDIRQSCRNGAALFRTTYVPYLV